MEELILRSPKQQKMRNVLWTHDRNATSVALNPDWRGRMLIPYGNRIGGGMGSAHAHVGELNVCKLQSWYF